MPIIFNQCDFVFQKQYAVLLDGPPDMASPAPKRKALASVDEQSRTDEMKHNLEVEEKRANQMKLLIQKLLMADVSGYVQIIVYIVFFVCFVILAEAICVPDWNSKFYRKPKFSLTFLRW